VSARDDDLPPVLLRPEVTPVDSLAKLPDRKAGPPERARDAFMRLGHEELREPHGGLQVERCLIERGSRSTRPPLEHIL